MESLGFLDCSDFSQLFWICESVSFDKLGNVRRFLVFSSLKFRICKPRTSCVLGRHYFCCYFSGGWGRQSSPPSFSFSSWAPDTKEGEVFCVLGPGAVTTVYICALPLPWCSPASTIGCPVFSLLFRLSNLDCSLNNSVVLCRPLSGFRRIWFQLCLLRSKLDGWFCFSISWQVFFSFMSCIFIIAH